MRSFTATAAVAALACSVLVLIAPTTSWAFGKPKPAPQPQRSANTDDRLRALRSQVRTWALTCPDGSLSDGNCPYGDMTLFAGISCFAGEHSRCDNVARAQGSNGRWWRSPGLVDQEDINTFSRDQTLGLLAYFTRNFQFDPVGTRSQAQHWLAWLETNDERTCRASSDTRCWINPPLWGLIGHVWKSMGLRPSLRMMLGALGEDTTHRIEAKTAPLGYPLHLIAVVAMLRQEFARRHIAGYGGMKSAVQTLVERQPDNPFFLYLRDGATQQVAQMVLDKCPVTRPDTGGWWDWAWQRDEAQAYWQRSNGWDCIFMVNLLVGPDGN